MKRIGVIFTILFVGACVNAVSPDNAHYIVGFTTGIIFGMYNANSVKRRPICKAERPE